MSMVDDSWTPNEDDIDEALNLYDQWLVDAYRQQGSREEAFAMVSLNFDQSSAKETFVWLTQNSPDRIYDIDEQLPE